MDNYNQLLERISQSAGISVEDLDRKVEAKRAKLSGLVSKEGAAQIIAAELGINFEKERMKIAELVEGMKRANILGKIINIFPVRGFSKNGKDGKVGSFLIADESSNVRIVLWDTNHISLIESGELNAGDVLEISNASVRNGEVHLSSFGDLKKSSEKLGEVVVTKVASPKHLKDAKSGQNIQSRAVIVQVFEPRYFEVCSQCGKKVLDGQCAVHGSVTPIKRALLNIVLDDGTESIRSVVFGDQIMKLGLTNDEIFNLDAFLAKKDSLLGEEKIFSGSIRTNSLYSTIEFNIEQINEIKTDELIKELEASA